jgi:cytochrome c peroxidase
MVQRFVLGAGVAVGAGLVVGVLAVGRPVVADEERATLLASRDPSGELRTLDVNGRLDLDNPFFKELGTNGRTCFSCHRPEQGWTITPESVRRRFDDTRGLDPIFRNNDGSNCGGADIFTLSGRRTAFSTLRRLSTGETMTTTDPGRAMVSGKWADVGKFKGPILRGLAARAPYFHNGSAASIEDAIDFYVTRFNLVLTVQEKADLAAFLRAL